ncbi:zinc finger BED domain-containing protein 4-like [Prorops nasuta]|uniref:zinc finger BED domain-containing protein 4-like n=1 Tax=Prorops nasuta TaxID=863751 RepID=UPI0034CE1279
MTEYEVGLENLDEPDCLNNLISSSSSATISSDSLSVMESPYLRKQPRIDMSLYKQNSYQAGGNKETEITNSLLFMIAKDNMPYLTVAKEGFQAFIRLLCPLYRIPSRSTLTRLLEQKYEILSEKIKLYLHQTEYLSLTTDIWTDLLNVKSYLGLTCHYIYDDKHKSVALGVTELNDKHSSENLEAWLLNTVDQWKICFNSIICIVSDNGANIKKAIKDAFGADKHLSCFAHSLHLVPSKILECDEIHLICKKIKSIVTYFKKSVTAMDSLRAVSNLKLIQSVDTRWNSTHDMLERFIELSDKVGSILLRFPAAPVMVTATELQILKEFIELLKPFKEATKIICGEFYLTASKVIPIISTLKKKLNQLNPTTAAGNKMKEQLIQQFELRFCNIEKEFILACATILDPRFKSIHFMDQIACTNITNKLATILNDSVSNDENYENYSDINMNTNHFWYYHETLVHEIKSKGKDNFNNIPEDLRVYLNQPPIQIDACPINYWKMNNSALNKLGRKYLATIASSVPCERLFSKAGRIVTESRNRLNGTHLQQLLFLGSLHLEDWKL